MYIFWDGKCKTVWISIRYFYSTEGLPVARIGWYKKPPKKTTCLQRHDGIHGLIAFIYTQLAPVPNTSESSVDISQSRLGNQELVAAYILCNML